VLLRLKLEETKRQNAYAERVVKEQRSAEAKETQRSRSTEAGFM
jgi:hypothetical protein